MTTARSGRLSRGGLLKAAAFLLPAALFLGAMLVYPIIFTAIRSTFDASGQNFVGLGNYVKIFSEPRTLVAIRNNLIWVLVVPIAVTGIGLILAVLSNNLRFRSAFRLFLFLPLVVSGLAAGVTFRFLYAADPDVGAVNALVRGVAHIFQPPGDYPTARPAATAPLEALDGGFLSTEPVASGSTLNLGLVGIMPGRLPEGSERALAAEPAAGTVQGTVWLDASAGGTPGVIDEAELGLPGITVQLLSGNRVEGSALTDGAGRFSIEAPPGDYQVQLAPNQFRAPHPGVAWLGPALITPAIMIGYIWMQTGFALIIVGAGLSGIDKELQESARIEGATEFQVLRQITIPLLAPVLLVVMVTTTISVLKIFDLVLVIAPESLQQHANVLALEMWRASFGGARDFGLGSALSVVLFLLIIPAMIFNLRRFKAS